jgi:hypothetical protein
MDDKDGDKRQMFFEDRKRERERQSLVCCGEFVIVKEGVFVIVKDDPNARAWYCAEVRKILADRIEVNYYTTVTPAILNYLDTSITLREERLGEAKFLRTWCLNRGKGLPTTTPPLTNHGKMRHLWWGRIPLEDISKHTLVRGVGLSALGKLDADTIKLAA